MLFAGADFENSIRITAMIGTGLIATPTASPSTAPVASPMFNQLAGRGRTLLNGVGRRCGTP